MCGGAASWPCTDSGPARVDSGPHPDVAGEEEGGAEVEPALRPGRPRQQVNCCGEGRFGILALY